MSRIWILSGPTGAGKTTVADALCARYPLAIHIPVDDIREWVLSGYASPIDATHDPDEVRRQFQLARQAASRLALDYAAEGFAVVIDDVVGGLARDAYDRVVNVGARRVLLMPTLDVALERNRKRTNKAFDTAVLDPVTRDLHEYMTRENTAAAGWTVIDSTSLSVAQTVDEIVRRCGL